VDSPPSHSLTARAHHRPALALPGWPARALTWWPASAQNWCCFILLRLVPLWRDARSLADWGPFWPSIPLDAFHLMEPLSACFPPGSAISFTSRHLGGGTSCSIPVITYLRIFCQRGVGVFLARPFSSCGVPLWVKLSMVPRCPSHPRTLVSPTSSGPTRHAPPLLGPLGPPPWQTLGRAPQPVETACAPGRTPTQMTISVHFRVRHPVYLILYILPLPHGETLLGQFLGCYRW
jgi:hypothetical protein